MKITFVKKIKIDGSPCRKCAEVQSRLEKDGHIDKIDRTVIADERDNNSEGMQLAKQYEVDRAPFFIVENDVGDPLVFTVYFKFVNEILSGKTNEEDAAKDILDSNDLDFI
jgi:methyltransferase-like protein